MPDTIAFQIAEKALQRLTPLAAEVILSPTAEPQAFPAIHLDDDGEEIIEQQFNSVRARLLLTVVGYVQGGETEGLRAARNLDALILKVLMEDQQFDGLTTLIDVGALANERLKLASKPGVTFRRQYDVQFSYRTIDPSLVGG
jgi:hypothetical protein